MATCDEVIVEDCQRTELNRSRKTSGENMTTAVSSTMTPISRTKQQDLPIEVLDYILMKAVVKKVMDRRLVKSVWPDYASRVIQSMRTVWSQWNYRLRTNWFRIDPAAISVASILVASNATEPRDLNYTAFAKLGNQIYLACTGQDDDDLEEDSDYPCLIVFQIEDLLHCTRKIPLPALEKEDSPGMAACELSNSVYVWGCGPKVLHLVPDGNGDFEALYWPPYSPSDYSDGADPTDGYCCINGFSVLNDGNVLVKRFFAPNVDQGCAYRVDVTNRIEILSVHRPDGFVVRNIRLPLPMLCIPSNVAMKSNGNFVYADVENAIVTEVDGDGTEVRSSRWKGAYQYYQTLFLDSYDRVILLDGALNLVFLDAELNFICVVEIEVDLEFISNFVDACFCKETNELIIFSDYGDFVFVKLAL